MSNHYVVSNGRTLLAVAFYSIMIGTAIFNPLLILRLVFITVVYICENLENKHIYSLSILLACFSTLPDQELKDPRGLTPKLRQNQVIFISTEDFATIGDSLASLRLVLSPYSAPDRLHHRRQGRNSSKISTAVVFSL